jgi:glycosyltransferase involved in cell wall biosynthesis
MKTFDIVFVAHFAGSPKHGMVHAYYSLAQEWLRQGHRVTIVAASFAHTRSRQPVQSRRIAEEWIDGIRYLWVPTTFYSPNNYLGRVVNILSFVVKTWWGQLPIANADVVICSSHHPFAIHPARKLAQHHKARLVFEVRDLWPLSLIELGGASKWNPLIVAMQLSENYAYRHADIVVSVLSGASEYMVARGLDSAKFHFIPNGIDLQDAQKAKPLPESHAAILADLRARGRFLVGYAGRVTLANALPTLIDALARCNDQRITVVVLGDGAFREALQSRVAGLNLTDKVIFLPPVEKAEVQAFLTQVDTLYVGLQKQPLFRFGVSPTKLSEYMLAGRPILYAIDAPGDVVSESGAGISCRAENADDLAQAMMRLSELPKEELNRMGELGQLWVKEHRDYRILAQRFIEAVVVR